MATKIPQNQLDALPLLTEGTVGNPDEVIVTGQRITRKWNPNSTGINGQSSNVADPTGGGAGAFLLTNEMDFTGMVNFTCTLGVMIAAVGGNPGAAVGWTVRIIPRAVDSSGNVIPVTGYATPINNQTGTYGAGAFPQVGSLNTPVMAGGTYPMLKQANCSWAIGGNSAGAFLQTGALGICRLWLQSNNGADPALNYLTVIAST